MKRRLSNRPSVCPSVHSAVKHLCVSIQISAYFFGHTTIYGDDSPAQHASKAPAIADGSARRDRQSTTDRRTKQSESVAACMLATAESVEF